MADTLTLTYDFTKPEIGASKDTWGDKLNANWEKIDLLLTQAFTGGDFDTIGTIKTGVLPDSDSAPYVRKAGSTMSGNLSIETATTPGVIVGRTANAAGLKLWAERVEGTTGSIVFRPLDDAKANLSGFLSLTRDANGLTDAQVSGGTGWNDIPQSANSLITRGRGDGRYLLLTGGTVGDLSMAHIRLTSTSDATLTSTGHAFQIGPDTGINLRIDSNEILALNNGALSGLDINAADVEITSPLTVQGTVELFGGLKLNQGGTNYINSAVATADIVFRFNGVDTYRLQSAGGNTPESTGTLLSRTMGDTRYIQGVTAGNGMTGGGTSGTVTVTMGTPGAITDTSTNGVSGTTHTHSLSELSVRRLIAEGAVNVLGTYGLCYDSAISTTRTQGSTLGGANLMFCNADGGERGAALSGTWMIYGRAGATNDAHRTSLWMKKA